MRAAAAAEVDATDGRYASLVTQTDQILDALDGLAGLVYDKMVSGLYSCSMLAVDILTRAKSVLSRSSRQLTSRLCSAGVAPVMAARPATAETIEAKLTILVLEGTVESYQLLLVGSRRLVGTMV